MANKTNNRVNNNQSNATQFVCPECGAKLFNLPEHSHVVTGIAVGKDTNLGEVELPRTDNNKPAKTAEERIEMMRAKGIDVSAYFAIKGANGGSSLGRLQDGVISMVEDDDPILKQILEDGDIPNRDLFRRWVMAQMFRALSFSGYGRNAKVGFTEYIKWKGYEYQWKMLEEELRVQSKLSTRDEVNFKARNQWFNKELVEKMCDHYRTMLNEYIKARPVKHCKGIRYIHIGGKDVFISDLYTKVHKPLNDYERKIRKADNIHALYTAVHYYNTMRIKLNWKTELCHEWLDAYKGVGAYYTMQNLIRFHGCCLVVGHRLTRDHSLKMIDKMASNYANDKQGFKMLGALKQMLRDNHIDIEKKMAEWRK